LVLVGLDNSVRALKLPQRRYIWPRFSPDGSKILVNIQEGQYVGAWIGDPEQQSLKAVPVKGNVRFPIWSPDGQKILFTSDLSGAGQWRTYLQSVDGGKAPELVFDARMAGFGWLGPESFASDGKAVVGTGSMTIATDPQAGSALMTLRLGTAPVMTEVIPAQPKVGMYNARLSPDGRLVAYVSNRSGRAEVWLSPYPGPGQAVMVSKDGGQRIVWSRDGKKIYFTTGNRMMVADVTLVPDLQVSAPRVQFETVPYAFGDYFTEPNWDISPDGKYFVMIRASQEPTDASQGNSANRLKLVTNFFAELNQKVAKR
jgi:serine/threonine-protein kinase